MVSTKNKEIDIMTSDECKKYVNSYRKHNSVTQKDISIEELECLIQKEDEQEAKLLEMSLTDPVR